MCTHAREECYIFLRYILFRVNNMGALWHPKRKLSIDFNISLQHIVATHFATGTKEVRNIMQSENQLIIATLVVPLDLLLSETQPAQRRFFSVIMRSHVIRQLKHRYPFTEQRARAPVITGHFSQLAQPREHLMDIKGTALHSYHSAFTPAPQMGSTATHNSTMPLDAKLSTAGSI